MLARIEQNWRTAGLSAQRKAMLEYTEILTHNPGDIMERDVIALRQCGFSDRDILDICEVTAYYAYVNRIADGLGVPTESWLSDDDQSE